MKYRKKIINVLGYSFPFWPLIFLVFDDEKISLGDSIFNLDFGILFYFFYAAYVIFFFIFFFPLMHEGNSRTLKIEKISKKFILQLSQLTTLEKLFSKIVHFIRYYIGFESAEFFIFDSREGNYTSFYTYSKNNQIKLDDKEGTDNIFRKHGKLNISIYSPMIFFLEDYDAVLVKEDIKEKRVKGKFCSEDLIKFQELSSFDILVPLILNKSLVGFITLSNLYSEKSSNNKIDKIFPFLKKAIFHGIKSSGIALLEKIRFQISASLSHALLYKRIVGLNENLERKVKEKTRDLEHATAQLIQSEKMASIGMLVAGVAHEVNTPAGVVKGSIDNISKLDDILIHEIFGLISLNIRKLDIFRLLKISRELIKNKPLIGLTGKEKIIKEKEIELRLKRRIDFYSTKFKASISKTKINLKKENPRDEPYELDELAQVIIENKIEASIDSIVYLGLKYGFEHFIPLITSVGNWGQNVRNIDYAISNIVKIIQALKNYSHIETGKKDWIEIHQGIENTLVILQNRIKRSCAIEKEFEELPEILCFADELNQVWTNLLNNALDSMLEKGDSQIKIRTSFFEELSKQDLFGYRDFSQAFDENYKGPWVAVNIIDNGKGIDKETQNRIFDPFFTTKDHSKGTGLGLGIVENIIKKHNGRIYLKSELNKTDFLIVLPVNWLESKK